MKTHWLNLVGSLCLLAVLNFAVYAADISTWKQPIRNVTVKVSAPEDIRDSVNSYLNRELRSLGDVELVDNGEWEISVVAMEVKATGGGKRGVALSTVIIQHFDPQFFQIMFQPKYIEIGIKEMSDLSYPPEQWLMVGRRNELQQLCQEIIIDFDTKILEYERQFFRQLKESVQKYQKSK
ncbi:MAG: hypothetical protein GY799_11325 [Desulfobulbaceae bacterium]|nr:hypothetical protein [Desulfobulbaceae bacterium]